MSKIPPAWNLNIDFIGRMNYILIASVVATVLSIASFVTKGLNFGTDFAGGYEMQVQFPMDVSETQIRELLEPMALQDASVQRYGEAADHEYLILVRDESNIISEQKRHEIQQALEQLAGGPEHLVAFSLAESGENFMADFDRAIDEAALRNTLAPFEQLKIKKITHNEHSERFEYTVSLYSLSDEITAVLQKGLQLSEDTEIVKKMDFVGPQVGGQLRNNGILAVVYSLLTILVYVAIRFDLFFSPGAIVATLHDIVVTMGVFSFFQIEFNLTVVAAILTLIGWSLNDTIVVYDRIRENAARMRGRELHALVNASINETMSRTILTSGTVFMVVLSLLLLGGPHIRAFSIAMFVGVIVGTYSSIAIASPIYILLRERAEKKAHRNGTVLKGARTH